MDCTQVFADFFAATGCSGCLDEMEQDAWRSATFCEALPEALCPASVAPCTAPPHTGSARTGAEDSGTTGAAHVLLPLLGGLACELVMHS